MHIKCEGDVRLCRHQVVRCLGCEPLESAGVERYHLPLYEKIKYTVKSLLQYIDPSSPGHNACLQNQDGLSSQRLARYWVWSPVLISMTAKLILCIIR